VARQRAAEPGDENEDVETEPHARHDVSRRVLRELASVHAVGDALREASEKCLIERVTHTRRSRPWKHQLANEDARELGLGRVESEERTEHVLGLGGDRRVGRHRAKGLVDRARERVLEDERDEIFLRGRVQKERALGDARALGDGRGGRGIEPALDEERSGRLADSRSFVLFVGFAAHDY